MSAADFDAVIARLHSALRAKVCVIDWWPCVAGVHATGCVVECSPDHASPAHASTVGLSVRRCCGPAVLHCSQRCRPFAA
jgi:hypothetical protein